MHQGQGQHRHDHRRRDEAVVTDVSDSHRASHGEDKDHRSQKKEHNQHQQGQIVKYAALVLAAGLGFGVGVVYSSSSSSSRSSRRHHHHKHKDAEFRHQHPPVYRIESCVEGYESLGRLEYRQPEDRMSYRAESVRESHGSGRWPDQSDGPKNWR